MRTYVLTITLLVIAEILFRTYRLATGTWRPSTQSETVIGLCLFIVQALWGFYLVARGKQS